jgi:NDP-sugar pyrophosphorylase family protein
MDASGSITGRVLRGSGQPSFHFVGVQVTQAAAFDTVPPDTPYESVAALYPALIAAQPGSVRAFTCSAEFFDIGTPADYLTSSLLIGRRERLALDAGRHCDIAAGAQVIDSVLWDDVVVEAGAMLRETIVTDGVRVPADTAWHGVTLRRAAGELTPGEKRIGDLAVCSL